MWLMIFIILLPIKGQKSQKQITMFSFLPQNEQKSFLTFKGG